MVYCQEILKNPIDFISEIHTKLSDTSSHSHIIDTTDEDIKEGNGYYIIEYTLFNYSGDMNYKREEIQALIQSLADSEKKLTM